MGYIWPNKYLITDFPPSLNFLLKKTVSGINHAGGSVPEEEIPNERDALMHRTPVGGDAFL